MASARAGTILTLRAVGSTVQGWLEHRIAFKVKQHKDGVRISSICRELSSESSASEIRKALLSLSELGIIRLDPNSDLVFPRRPQIDEFLRNPKEGWDFRKFPNTDVVPQRFETPKIPKSYICPPTTKSSPKRRKEGC